MSIPPGRARPHLRLSGYPSESPPPRCCSRYRLSPELPPRAPALSLLYHTACWSGRRGRGSHGHSTTSGPARPFLRGSAPAQSLKPSPGLPHLIGRIIPALRLSPPARPRGLWIVVGEISEVRNCWQPPSNSKDTPGGAHTLPSEGNMMQLSRGTKTSRERAGQLPALLLDRG
jgi:hypothetical protein